MATKQSDLVRKIIFSSGTADDATAGVRRHLSGEGSATRRAQLAEELGSEHQSAEQLSQLAMQDAKMNQPFSYGMAFGGPAAHGSGPFGFKASEGANMFTRAMEGGVGGMVGGGLIGGTASYATGGEFWQGAAAGSMGGFAMRGAYRTAFQNSPGLNQMVKSAAEGEGKFSKMAQGMMQSSQEGRGMMTLAGRHAMMAGAALGGMSFGGNRNNHRRGFNAHRGNTF
tara:strand:- start:11443 stop:12120 length:678 start_codon:yes stop_codon:yes gene_type:complete